MTIFNGFIFPICFLLLDTFQHAMHKILLLIAVDSANGNLRTLLPMQVRSIFSSAGVGIDGFKLSREQHAARYAPSIGKKL